MGEIQIRYDDGVAYERMMGTWSRTAGKVFLDWLAPSRGFALDRRRLRDRRIYGIACRTLCAGGARRG